MIKIIPILASFLISILQFHCEDTGVQPIDLQFSDIENMRYFRVEQPKTLVIRTQKEWDSFLRGSFFPPSNLHGVDFPRVDFNEEMVIGVFWGGGCKYSGCTNVSRSIERLVMSLNGIEVKVGPLQDLGLCEACVSPLHIVKVEKSELPVVFVGNLPA